MGVQKAGQMYANGTRSIQAMPAELRKDIGWPDSYDRNPSRH